MLKVTEIAFGLEKSWTHRRRDAWNMPWHVGILAMMLGILWGDAQSPSPWTQMTLDLCFFIVIMPLVLCLFLFHRVHKAQDIRRKHVFLWFTVWFFLWLVFGSWLGISPTHPILPEREVCEITAIADPITPGMSQITANIQSWACAEKKGTGAVRVRMTMTPEELAVITTQIVGGTVFRTRGIFERYESPDVPGMFNAKRWAHSQRLDGRVSRRHGKSFYPIQILENPASLGLELSRRYTYEKLANVSEEGILPALVLGSARDIDSDTRNTFGRLGIAHVLAVSGLHFGIIAIMVNAVFNAIGARIPWLMRRLGRQRFAAIASIPVLAIYLIFVGAPISAQRALLMTIVCLVGRLMDRSPSRIRSLMFAVLIILVIDPSALFQISFQLSAAAVLGIIWGMEIYDQYVKRRLIEADLPRKVESILSALISAMCMTLSTSLTTAPIVIFHFEQLPILGIFANLPVIPYVSFVLMPAAMVAAFASVVNFPGADGLIVLAGKCESVLTYFADFYLENVPLSCLDIPPKTAILLATTAMAVVVLYRFKPQKWRFVSIAIVATATVLLLILSQLETRFSERDGLWVSFVAMGQADATLLEFPNGHIMLVDAGSELGREENAVTTRLLPYLRWRGIHHIDTLILTHGDYDHVAGVEALLKALRVGQIWHNGSPSALWTHAVGNIPHIDVRTLSKVHRESQVKVDILWPRTGTLEKLEAMGVLDANESSVVLRVEYGAFSMMLMGDAGIPVEEQLLLRQMERATVLKVGHHGSKSATSEDWVNAIAPHYAVFSASRHNRYRFPHASVSERLAKRGTRLYQTGIHGTIRMLTDGRHLKVETMR